MDEIKEAFEMVLGKEFIDEMISRLIIIGSIVGAILLLIILIVIWKSIASHKIKKLILGISEHPDDSHADEFINSSAHISALGRFFAKTGRGFSGLTKGECRNIYNTTVLNSSNISNEKKEKIRIILTKFGCTGLTASSND